MSDTWAPIISLKSSIYVYKYNVQSSSSSHISYFNYKVQPWRYFSSTLFWVWMCENMYTTCINPVDTFMINFQFQPKSLFASFSYLLPSRSNDMFDILDWTKFCSKFIFQCFVLAYQAVYVLFLTQLCIYNVIIHKSLVVHADCGDESAHGLSWMQKQHRESPQKIEWYGNMFINIVFSIKISILSWIIFW